MTGKLSLPVRALIAQNAAIVLMYAYSRGPLGQAFGQHFRGEWDGVYESMFTAADPIAEKACLELALFFRYVDDEDERSLSDFFKQRTRDFGRLIDKDGSERHLHLRDVADKIIHAASLSWEFPGDEMSPVLVCHARESDKRNWAKAEVHLLKFIAVCGQL